MTTHFIDGETVITAAWLNNVDNTVETLPTAYGSTLVGAATYAQLRQYTGTGTRIQVGGRTNYFDRAQGIFVRTGTELDDDGTVLVDALGRSWQRDFSGPVNVVWFGAGTNGSPGADNVTPIQSAIDCAKNRGFGCVYVPSGEYEGPNGLILMDDIALLGESRETTKIYKNTANTKNVTIYSGSLVVYDNRPLPSAMNAVLTLTGVDGRYTGKVSDLTFGGTYATPGNYESQVVEFGVVSVGSVSDFSLERTYINSVQYGTIFPTIFASVVQNNRLSECLQAVGIDDGTSLTYTSNYANNCRDGHFIRGIKYSQISANAADYTNDPAKYPTRNTVHFAYRLRSLVGCEISANGNEQTWGRSIWMETLDNCSVKNNLTIGVGSDYTGSSNIAVLYSDGVLRNCEIIGNLGYGVKTGGLIYGGANPALHHNMYFETTRFVLESTLKGNIVQAALAGIPVEAGWGNNNPSNWINSTSTLDLVQTFTPTLAANSPGDLSITYGSDNKHYRHDVGNLYHVFGCFDATFTYTTAGSYLIFQGFPENQSIPWRIVITGVDNDGPLSKKLGSFVLNENQGNGIAFDENGNTFLITDIPTGTNLKIYYDGWYAKV